MTNDVPQARTLTFPELVVARRGTDIIARYLQDQLVGYLETLRPLLDPDRLLGRFSGGKVAAPAAEKVVAQIREAYSPFTARPVNLPRDFDPSWLAEIDNTLELHRWEYSHEVRTGSEAKVITISHPTRWVLSYKSGCSLSQYARTIVTKEDRRSDSFRKFVINALVAASAVQRCPGFQQLLFDLRYRVEIQEIAGLAQLPLVTISSVLESFRPADDLILAATSFSGVSAFNELIDMSIVETLEDPLKLAIAERVKAPTAE